MPQTLSCEQLQDRLAALHQAALELVQDISLESLLQRIATLACEQVEARYAAVGVQDETGKLMSFIPVGMEPEVIAQMDHPPVGLGLIGALMHTHETIRLDDIAGDPRSSGFPNHHPPMTSFLGVPIWHAETQVGQIYLTNKAGGATFTEDDQMVIETLASYAAIAISNARLYRQLLERDRTLTRRNEYLALLNELASTLASSTDVSQILDKTLSQVLGYLDIETGEIFLRQEDGINLKLAHHHGSKLESLFTRQSFLVGVGMVGSTASSAQPIQIDLPAPEQRELNQVLQAGGYSQVACFPLSGRGGVLGAMCIAVQGTRPLDEMEVQFLSAISAWVGTAVENVELNQQQRRLAVLEERERIGMDLHDGIIQSIYAVGLTLEHARLLMGEDIPMSRQRITQAVDDLNKTIRDIRTYILDLRPRQFHDENLMEGLQRLVNEFKANTLVEINLQGNPSQVEALTEARAMALFHICQEALANIAKHARARRVEVVVWSTTERVLMEITDDGRGFDLERMKLTLGHGLMNIQTRTHSVGGDVEISSTPGEGTTILAWVPAGEA
ncbi:MAG TPA: GAF domain-containing sensor histidine kinase [Anaerolineaceae bacterium]|nr:GAF domain-containing sensor histidine kinase [Anaerolineaceae bacterium]